MIIPISPSLQGMQRVDISKIESLQGNLKKLNSENYYKLKESLIVHGFFIPLFVWHDKKEGIYYFADGHQRNKVLTTEAAQAYEVLEKEYEAYINTPDEEKEEFIKEQAKARPDKLTTAYPCIMVNAKNKTEAKKRLLVISSQYGKMQRSEFKKFVEGIETDYIHNTINFDAVNINTALRADEENETYKEQIEKINTPKETQTKKGDIYEIFAGNLKHRIICGDAKDPEDVSNLCEKPAQMIFTDPPYNVKISGLGSKGKQKGKQYASISNHEEFHEASGEMTKDEFIQFLRGCFINLIDNSKRGAVHFICMDWRHLNELLTAGEVYAELKNLIVWNKDRGGMGTFYRSKHEFIAAYKNGSSPAKFLNGIKKGIQEFTKGILSYFENPTFEEGDKATVYFDAFEFIAAFKSGFKKDKVINNFELGQYGRSRSNVWDYPTVNSFKSDPNDREAGKTHPTVKPFQLVKDAILDCSTNDGIILDVFAGSGTTLIAADDARRNARLLEYSERYCDTIIARYINYKTQKGGKFEIKKNGENIDFEEYKQ